MKFTYYYIQDYLNNGRSSPYDIQALTIMDTTFINNRQRTVETTGVTSSRPHKYYAYIDILKTENGRQYGMNIFNEEDTYNYRTATAIELGGESNNDITENDSTEKNNDTLAENDGSGVCRGIGTQTFCVTMPLDTQTFDAEPSSSDIEAGHKMRNLCFRLTITGQNGIRKNYSSNSNGPAGTDFYYDPPTDYKALRANSLPDPEIAKPSDHFQTVIYTGDGSNPKTISGVGFASDMIWLKSRGHTNRHNIYDTVRGIPRSGSTDVPRLSPDDNTVSGDTSDELRTVTSDGFTVDSSRNGSGNTFVAWCWKAGGSASSNTQYGQRKHCRWIQYL